MPTSSPPVETGTSVSTVDLIKSYGAGTSPVFALRGVSLEILRGERVALLGKSGSGKSTLLNLLGGLDHPTSGVLRVGGHDLGKLSRRELSRFRSKTVGMIFQSFNLIPSRTALENVELPMIFAGRPPRERRASAKQALETVGLGERLRHHPTEMSGGENQRVAVARALVNRPEIVLADEPTGNLDSATAREVMGLILEHVSRHNATLVLVTHDDELAQLHRSPAAPQGRTAGCGRVKSKGEFVRPSDLLTLPFAALWQQKLRTMLTTLGVIFGAFVLAASLSIGEGIQETIDRESRRNDIARRVQVSGKWDYTGPPSRSADVKVEGKMDAARRDRIRKLLVDQENRSNPAQVRMDLTRDRLKAIAGIPHVESMIPVVYNVGFAVLGTVPSQSRSIPPVRRTRTSGTA